MKKVQFNFKMIIILIFVLIFQGVSFAQNSYEIDNSSRMSIIGILNIENLKFTIPVVSIESGNSIMNGKTFKALKYKDFPNIEYKLKSIDVQSDNSLKSTGTLTVAGVSKDISFPVECNIHNGFVNVIGSIEFKMTDFNVDPPTALMGTLKTGDDIVIAFDVNFKQSVYN